jgi:putative addiction module component (TIGR02574 family)
MKSKIEKIRETALLLSPAERASLIHDLILSLDDETAYDLAPEYESEIKRRVDYVKEGKASGEPAKSVFEDIEKKYP